MPNETHEKGGFSNALVFTKRLPEVKCIELFVISIHICHLHLSPQASKTHTKHEPGIIETLVPFRANLIKPKRQQAYPIDTDLNNIDTRFKLSC